MAWSGYCGRSRVSSELLAALSLLPLVYSSYSAGPRRTPPAAVTMGSYKPKGEDKKRPSRRSASSRRSRLPRARRS
jgi:hypothetical protein